MHSAQQRLVRSFNCKIYLFFKETNYYEKERSFRSRVLKFGGGFLVLLAIAGQIYIFYEYTDTKRNTETFRKMIADPTTPYIALEFLAFLGNITLNSFLTSQALNILP
jgi:hypothetical protein